ncbi:MAG: hypothetical protein FD177_992 [Desulfovibrionaceae bacterium]|nr:MAG: hypothetical protein FD177_992 [Desulfovibrionaceae bacterium]
MFKWLLSLFAAKPAPGKLDFLKDAPARQWAEKPTPTPPPRETVVRFQEIVSDYPRHSIMRRIPAKVAGVSHDNFDGSSRQNAIKRLKVGQKIRIAHHTNNEHHENALGLFSGSDAESYKDQPPLALKDQIGWVKSDLADDMVAWEAGPDGMQLYAEVEEVMPPSAGCPNYGVRVSIYIHSDDGSELEEIDPNTPAPHLPFRERLERQLVQERVIMALLEAGIDAPEKVQTTSDKELLKIKGLGKVTLESIRREFS